MSKIIERAPKLRFPEFSGSWKLKRLGDYLQPYSERVPAPTDLPVYSSTREGLKPQNEYYNNRELANDGEYGVVPPGYFVYRHMSDDLTFKFNINTSEASIAVSKEYPVFTTKGLNRDFLLLKLNNGVHFKKYAAMQKMGGTRTRLYYKNLADWGCLQPEPDEQRHVANSIAQVASKIFFLKDKKDKLSQYKFNLCNRIFLQELKFKSDDGSLYPSWKTKKLKDFAKVHKGGGLSKNDTAVSGAYKCLLYGELFTKYKESITETYLYTNKEDGCLSNAGDILMPASDVTPYGLATASTIFLDNVRVGGDINIIRLSAGYNPVFFTYQIKSKRKEIIRLVTGTTVKHLYPKDILNISFFCPVEEEQEKIANFLSTFDRKIEAVEQQILKLERFKQGLLQQMFV